jgi:hypothetical protein
MNPSYLTGVLPGGAGVQVSGTSTNPGISAPRLEESTIEVLDVTAPSLINTVLGNTLATPAPLGKLLVMDTLTGCFGARWKLNSVVKQAIPRGQYGVVYVAGAAQTPLVGPADAGYAVGTNAGNEASFGTKAVVMYDGPIQAFVQGTVGNVTISAGMPLAADGAGNLTYAGASPAAGTVLATYAGPTILSTVSIPVLSNVYMGGY